MPKPDMWAAGPPGPSFCDHAKNSSLRRPGPTRKEDKEATVAERCDASMRPGHAEIDRRQGDGRCENPRDRDHWGQQTEAPGADYLLYFCHAAYFHLTTAYDILRGVALDRQAQLMGAVPNLVRFKKSAPGASPMTITRLHAGPRMSQADSWSTIYLAGQVATGESKDVGDQTRDPSDDDWLLARQDPTKPRFRRPPYISPIQAHSPK